VEKHMEKRLKMFLDLFWLRPEKALIFTFRGKTFKENKILSPSLDISCGDGLFMFLQQGGTLDKKFDYFKSTNAKKFKHSSFIDIYNFDKAYDLKITKKAAVKIDYGIDWKQSLLDKAAKVGVYKNLMVHDNNDVPLPFEDNYFKTIYSNSAYWVKDVKSLTEDIYRMLKPGGTAILEVKTPYLLKTLDQMEKFLPGEAIAILNRKRRETMPGGLKYEEWKKIFKGCGFKLKEARSAYPDKIVMDIWNVGLRPISHLLIQMASELSPQKRKALKEEWVDIFFKLFKPILSVKQTYPLKRAPYLVFVLKK
jgi:SAM-dependent methyltransferase